MALPDIRQIGFANFFNVFANPVTDMLMKELGFDSSFNFVYKDEAGEIHTLPGLGDFLNLYNPNTIKVTQIAAQSTIGIGVEGDNHLKVATAIPHSFVVKATGIHERQVIVQYDKNNVIKNILPLPEFFCKLSSYADEFNVNTGILTENVKHETITTQPARTELTNNAIFKVAFLDTSVVATTLNYPMTVEANKDDVAYKDYTYIGSDNYLYIIKDKAIQELPLPFTVLNARTSPVTIRFPNTYFLFEQDDKFIMKSYRRITGFVESSTYEFIKQTESYAIDEILRAAKVTDTQTTYENLTVTETGKSVNGMITDVYYDVIVSTTENGVNPTLEYYMLDITNGLFSYLFKLIKDVSSNASGGTGSIIAGNITSGAKKYVFTYTFVATEQTSHFTIPTEIFSPKNGDVLMVKYDNLILEKDENYSINVDTNDIILGFNLAESDNVECLIFKYVDNDSSAAIIETLQTNINLNQVGLATHILATLNPHGATSEATPSRIISRDDDGRAKIVSPLLSEQIANKGYVDSKSLDFFPTSHSGSDYTVVVPVLTGNIPDGYGLCVRFDVASTGSATLAINSSSAYPIVDYYANPVNDIRAGLIAHLRFDASNGNFQLLGKGGDKSKELSLTKEVARLTAIADINDMVSGAQSVFYDTFDGTNNNSAGILDDFFAITATAITSGDTSVIMQSLENISSGSEVTINDGSLYERIIVASVDLNTKVISFKTPIVNNYHDGAHISRSHSIVFNNKLKSRPWTYDNNIMVYGGHDSSVHVSSIDVGGTNKDRQAVTEASNGWLIAAINSSTAQKVIIYISKDAGISWTKLSAINTNIGLSPNTRAVAYGTKITIMVNKYSLTFDVVTDVLPEIIEISSLVVMDSGVVGNSGGSLWCDPANGYLYAAWYNKETPYTTCYNIRFVKSVDRGQSWTKMDGTAGVDFVTTDDIDGIINSEPFVTTTQAGMPIIVYTHSQTSVIYAIKCKLWDGSSWIDSANNGIIFSNPYEYGVAYPSIARDHHGVIHAIWQGLDNGSTVGRNAMYSKTIDNGITWSAREKLTNYTTTFAINEAAISINDDDTIYILMHRSIGSGKEGIFVKSKQYGSNVWSAITPMSPYASTSISRINRHSVICYCKKFPKYIMINLGPLNLGPLAGFMFHGEYGHNTLTTPATVSESNYDISGVGARKITKLSNGWLIAAGYSATNSCIYFKVARDGYAWHTLCRYTTTSSVDGHDFAICSNGTDVYMVFASATDSYIHGVTFDATTVIEDSILTDNFIPIIEQSSFNGVSIAIHDNILHVAAVAKNEVYSDSYNALYTKSVDGGITWKDANGIDGYNNITHLNNVNDNYYSPTVVIVNDVVNILAQYISTGAHYIINWRHTTNWNSYNIHSDTYTQANVCATTDSAGCIHAVWEGLDQVDATYANVHYSKSIDGGITWSAQVKLTSGNSSTSANAGATISVDSKDVVYVYYYGPDTTANQPQVYETIYKDGAWSYNKTEVRIPSTTAGQITPQVVALSDSSCPDLIWNDMDNSIVQYRGINNRSIEPISLISNKASGNNPGGRQYVILKNGWHVYVFNDSQMGHDYIAYFMVSKDNGRNWSQLCYIGGSGLANVAYNISVDAVDNTVYVAFNSSTKLAGPVNMNVLKFDAETVSNVNLYANAVAIDTQTSFGYGCDIKLADDGTLYAVWNSKNDTYPNSFNLRYSKSVDDGLTWATPEYVESNNILNTSGAGMNFPVLSMDGNAPYIVSELIDGDLQHYVRINKLIAGVFIPTTITNYGSMVSSITNFSSVVAPNRKVYIAYHTIDSTNTKYNVYVASSVDLGATWTVSTAMNHTADYSLYPTITSDKNNRIYLLYTDKSATLNTANIAYRIFDGSNWSQQSVFSSAIFAPHYMARPLTPEKFRDFELFPPVAWYDQGGIGTRSAGLIHYLESHDVQVEDNRYNITAQSGGANSLVSWVSIEKDSNLSVEPKVSMVGSSDDESYISMSNITTPVSAEIDEIQSIYSATNTKNKVTLRLSVSRSDESAHSKSITKVLGAID